MVSIRLIVMSQVYNPWETWNLKNCCKSILKQICFDSSFHCSRRTESGVSIDSQSVNFEDNYDSSDTDSESKNNEVHVISSKKDVSMGYCFEKQRTGYWSSGVTYYKTVELYIPLFNPSYDCTLHYIWHKWKIIIMYP